MWSWCGGNCQPYTCVWSTRRGVTVVSGCAGGRLSQSLAECCVFHSWKSSSSLEQKGWLNLLCTLRLVWRITQEATTHWASQFGLTTRIWAGFCWPARGCFRSTQYNWKHQVWKCPWFNTFLAYPEASSSKISTWLAWLEFMPIDSCAFVMYSSYISTLHFLVLYSRPWWIVPKASCIMLCQQFLENYYASEEVV